MTTFQKNNQTQGWQEAWNFVPSPITNFQATSVFKPDIQECRNARWVELNFVNSNQKRKFFQKCHQKKKIIFSNKMQ